MLDSSASYQQVNEVNFEPRYDSKTNNRGSGGEERHGREKKIKNTDDEIQDTRIFGKLLHLSEYIFYLQDF